MNTRGLSDFNKILKLSVNKRDFSRLAVLLILIFLTAIGFGLIPLFFQWILGVASVDDGSFLIILSILVGVIVASQMLSHITDVMTMMFLQKLNINLGERFIEKTIGLSASDYLSKGPAQLAQVLQCASASMSNTFRSILSSIFPAIIQIIVSFAVLLSFKDFFVMSMIFLYVAIYAVLSSSMIGRLSALFNIVILREMESSKVVHNIVSNIETIRSYLASEYLMRFFRADQEGVYQSWWGFYKKGVFLEGVRVSLFALIFFAVLYDSSLRLLSGEIGVGHFVMVSAYMYQVCHPYDALLKNIGSVIESLCGFAPLVKHFESCGTHDMAGAELSKNSHELEFLNVGFSYPERPEEKILNDLSIRFSPGEVVAITGPSGVGKSTIIKLLMRLYTPSSGLISYGGVSVSDLSDQDFYSRFSFVSQDVGLFNETLRFNLRIADQSASDEKLEDVLKLANLGDLFKSLPLSLDTQIGDRGLMLSGGERQRLALARSFLRAHKVVVFDESTAFLDEETERAVISNIKKYNDSNIVIIVAHRKSILDLADRIISLDGKCCVEV